MQLLQGAAEFFTTSSGAGVAWWAHIGGFLAGLALAPILQHPVQTYRAYYPDEGILGFDTSGRP
jgi:membrane associated rhomboid family serine protease